jgi:BMFP domain-containing protein YqiC
VVISKNKALRGKIEQLEAKIITVETAASPRANVELVYS